MGADSFGHAMRRDVKTGMLIGLVVVTIAVIVISVWPGTTVEDRLRLNPARAVPNEPQTCLMPPIEAPSVNPPRQEASLPHVPPQVPETALEVVPGPAEAVTPAVPRQTVRQAMERIVEESRQSPPEKAAPFIHTVLKDESLSTIAQTHYGDANKWPIIAEANKKVLPNVHLLRPGMRLVIPPLEN